MNNTTQVFEAKELVKRYGRLSALKGINLTVNKGDFVSIFGPNGAGKTTFLKIGAMLMSPTSGDLLFNGVNIRKVGDQARKEIGYIAHNTFLYNNLTAEENLRFFGKMYSLPDLDDLIEDKLNAVGLSDRKNDIVSGFSRGMQQRLTIARAFLHDPSILLLDEPYTGLDKSASEILNGLLRLFNNTEKAGLMTTHNLDQGYDLATHLVILHKGKIQFSALKKDISKIEFSEKYSEIVGQ
ncbi:heme ABC exporter ATP-binding protein CcmA [candidate division KSB1 bacterium]